jgi:hypothetical protein
VQVAKFFETRQARSEESAHAEWILMLWTHRCECGIKFTIDSISRREHHSYRSDGLEGGRDEIDEALHRKGD